MLFVLWVGSVLFRFILCFCETYFWFSFFLATLTFDKATMFENHNQQLAANESSVKKRMRQVWGERTYWFRSSWSNCYVRRCKKKNSKTKKNFVTKKLTPIASKQHLLLFHSFFQTTHTSKYIFFVNLFFWIFVLFVFLFLNLS